MKRFTNKILPFVCLCVCAVAGVCAEAGAKPAAESQKAAAPKDYAACFAEWDGKMHTLQIAFSQITEYDGIEVSRSAGRIFYRREGRRLRLDNLDGDAVTQSALTDRKIILILDEKGKKISELDWNEWLSGQPNRALFDFGNYTDLLARHEVSVFERKGDLVILRLTPKQKTEDYVLYAALGAEDCFPVYLTLQSDLVKTTASLSDRKLNAALKKDVFKGLK